MLSELEHHLLSNWKQLPVDRPRPKRLAFMGQGTGVSKVCFFVFAEDESIPCCIAKIPRSPVYNDRLLKEVATIERLRAAVSDELGATLPGPMHTSLVAGQCVIVEPLLLGRPMDSLIVPRLPMDRALVVRCLNLALSWLVRIQREAPSRAGPLSASDVQSYFYEPIQTARQNNDLTVGEEDYLDRLVAEVASATKAHELGLVLYHGDFRAGNILVTDDHLAVLDWEMSQPLAPPLLDWLSIVFRLYSRARRLADIDGTLDAYRSAFDEVFFSGSWYSRLVADYTRLYLKELGIGSRHLPLLFGMFVVTNVNKFHAFLVDRSRHGYLYLVKGATRGQSYREQLRRQAYVWLLGEAAAKWERLAAAANGATSI